MNIKSKYLKGLGEALNLQPSAHLEYSWPKRCMRWFAHKRAVNRKNNVGHDFYYPEEKYAFHRKVELTKMPSTNYPQI